jgi:hypothetical protein
MQYSMRTVGVMNTSFAPDYRPSEGRKRSVCSGLTDVLSGIYGSHQRILDRRRVEMENVSLKCYKCFQKPKRDKDLARD